MKFNTLTETELQNTTGGKSKGTFIQGLFDGLMGPRKKK